MKTVIRENLEDIVGLTQEIAIMFLCEHESYLADYNMQDHLNYSSIFLIDKFEAIKTRYFKIVKEEPALNGFFIEYLNKFEKVKSSFYEDIDNKDYHVDFSEDYLDVSIFDSYSKQFEGLSEVLEQYMPNYNQEKKENRLNFN